MKPVVTSLVALALAIAPLAAWAGPSPKSSGHDRPVAAKVAKAAKHAKSTKSAPSTKKKRSKLEAREKVSVVQVKNTGKKHGKLVNVHHAQDVDVSGPGHVEPKSSVLVAASMTTKETKETKETATKETHETPRRNKHLRAVVAKEPVRRAELPALPDPNAGKPAKGGAEKGTTTTKKATSKVDEKKTDGELTRDEDFAELVARIRGLSTDEGSGKKQGKESKETKETKDAKASKKPCAKDPVEVIRGPEVERFPLSTCDGKLAPLAIEHLSILTRPGGAARPTAPLEELVKNAAKKTEISPGIRRLEERLVVNLAAVVDHFTKDGVSPKVSIVSGYRPTSVGSMHQTGRAIDFRLEGVKNEDVVGFCKTLEDTGCGFYPNSSFVHMDVRDAGAGHVTWIDASGPGESPRYVPTWPPPAPKTARAPKNDALETTSARHRDLETSEPVDEHPATPTRREDDAKDDAKPEAKDDDATSED